MTSQYYLQFANRGVLVFEDQGVVGVGGITPRLRLAFRANTGLEPKLSGRLLSLQVEMTFQNELLGTGSLAPQFHTIGQQPAGLPALDVPLSAAAVAFLRDEVRGDDLVLGVRFSGLFQADGRDCPPWITQQSESLLLPVSSDIGTLQVAHSEWIRKILKALVPGDHLLFSAHVPAPPNDGMWKSALSHLQAAEEAYNRGDDPTVLQKCHAVFESLRPRSPKTLFDSVSDPEKRRHVNELVLKTKGFLQSGRHVAKDGTLAGDFDVGHRDSEFALAQTKAWLAYLSRLI